MKRLLLFLEKQLVPIAVLIWVAELICLASHLGVKEGADTYLYLRFAQFGTFGDAYVDAHYQWYCSYTYFLSFFLKTRLGLTWAIGAQVLLASTCLWALYDMAKRVGGEKAGPWALLLYVLWVDSHVWHFYLYSDSLFVSCSIWCLWAFCKWKQTLPLVRLLPLVLFSTFVRPPGFVLLVVYMVVFVRSLALNRWAKGAIMLLLLGGCLLFVQQMLPTFEIIETYRKGEVIYSYSNWNLQPSTPIVLSTSENSLSTIFDFIWQNPLFFLQLALNKTAAFLAHVKPYYSWAHNLYIICLLFPSYSLFVSGWKWWQNMENKWIVLLWCLGQTALVASTIEDWDGRFLSPVVPFVFLGAGIGCSSAMQVAFRQSSSKK